MIDISVSYSEIELKSEIVNEIKLCYWKINVLDIDDECMDNSLIISAINSSVIAGNRALREFFISHPGVSFMVDKDEVIFESFINAITPITNRALSLVSLLSDEYIFAVDMTQLMLPFVMEQMGINDNNMLILWGLALLVTKYLVNKIDKHNRKKQSEELRNSLREVCLNNIEYLNILNKSQCIEEKSNVVESCIVANKKMLELINIKED